MGMRSPREKLMTIILAFVVIAAVWYLLFYTPTIDAMDDMDVAIEEIGQKDQLVKDQISVFKKWQEQLGLDMNSTSDDFTKIADYNNIVGLTDELNQIFAPAKSFNMTFTTPYRVPDKNAYRRDIECSFVATDYNEAYQILNKINESEHGCFINTLSINGGEGETTVGFKMSFFEYYQFEQMISTVGARAQDDETAQ